MQTVLFVGDLSYTNRVVNRLIHYSTNGCVDFNHYPGLTKANLTVEDSMETEEDMLYLLDKDNNCTDCEPIGEDALNSLGFITKQGTTPKAKLTFKAGDNYRNKWNVRFVEVGIDNEAGRLKELVQDVHYVVFAPQDKNIDKFISVNFNRARTVQIKESSGMRNFNWTTDPIMVVNPDYLDDIQALYNKLTTA